MTTFKNNAKYAELLFLYLDVAYRHDNPLTIPQVLRTFPWMLKGGALKDVSAATRLQPEVSSDVFPSGLSIDLAKEWPNGENCRALKAVLRNRAAQTRLRTRAMAARLYTFQVLTSSYSCDKVEALVFSGMKSVYHMFARIWDWSEEANPPMEWSVFTVFCRELMVGTSAACKVHLPSAAKDCTEFLALLNKSRIPSLYKAVMQMKDLLRLASSTSVMTAARVGGMETLQDGFWFEKEREVDLDLGMFVRVATQPLGPMLLKVSQHCAFVGAREIRYALSKSDMERLHQLVMSAASALVGVCCQSAVGTKLQKSHAVRALHVAERNIGRIVESSRKVQLGEEVLVCKGYRRAYTAHLGVLAGPLCSNETKLLVKEAEETAPEGVLDVRGFLSDLSSLPAEDALNAAKMFKICPAPDVSPGLAMMDRVKQIGNGNKVDKKMLALFTEELRTQILRALIRRKGVRLKLREGMAAPIWMTAYQRGEMDSVPSSEIHAYLAWEGCVDMPEISMYDPANWKDSGVGADTIREAMSDRYLGKRGNMITRLLFDDDCPMPGTGKLSEEHVIKFFVKAEGHKDPARGIFSANLMDRFAQSWMERAVETVSSNHPSFMIGQPVEVRDAKVAQLITPPKDFGWVALYYSFDISGWSAKMPQEPQKISHSIWSAVFNGNMFPRAHRINEDAYIYLNMDGYKGWFRNTHANLEGFNGKEMTMVLIALLSMSVRLWRVQVVTMGILDEQTANSTVALLFAYIDDGLCRIDLPKSKAMRAFWLYKRMVIETFAMVGFTVEVTKCFPSDRFAIFLNEVYLAGRHVVHGVRAAMAISAEPTERHTTLIERTSSVSTGIRGAIMAGLNVLSGAFLMAYHLSFHLWEWTAERDPVILAGWCMTPRAWGGLGVPNLMQLGVSGSGSAFEEGAASLQAYGAVNHAIKKVFCALSRMDLEERSSISVLSSPLSGKTTTGYMIDSRVASAVRMALSDAVEEGLVSKYAARLLQYANSENFREFAESVVPLGVKEVVQEQMLVDIHESHPHTIFASFAKRMEKSMTVRSVVGAERFRKIMDANRQDVMASIACFRHRMSY